MAGNLRQKMVRGEMVSIPEGPTLLERLWKELEKEWADPDVDSSADYDAGYCVGLAFAIAQIEMPYARADRRVENVLDRVRGKLS